jgi:hypothetical protein
MKITAIVLSFAFLVVVGSSSNSDAGRRAQMSGYEATYHSTGSCKAGACNVKKLTDHIGRPPQLAAYLTPMSPLGHFSGIAVPARNVRC